MESIFSPENLRRLLIFAPPFILSLSFHEWAHAWSAYKLGDNTAKEQNRMTLDPMAHIDWLGTVIIPAFGVLFNGPLFGWAKPVPVNPRNLKKPRQHMAIIALAGPVSNMFLATLLTGLLSYLIKFAPGHLASFQFMNFESSNILKAATEMCSMAIQLNLFLAFFNLLPIYPLDGSRILQGILPWSLAEKIERFGQQFQWIFLILIFTGALRFLTIPVYACLKALFLLFQIPI